MPRTTPTNGLKKVTFQGVYEVVSQAQQWNHPSPMQSGARPRCSRVGSRLRHPAYEGRLAWHRLPAETGRHLLALHSAASPPPRPLRGDHRPKVQQVRPPDELRDLRLVLHPVRPRRDWNNTKIARNIIPFS